MAASARPRIAQELQKDIGVGLNGIVLLSPVLDFGWFAKAAHSPLPHPMRLPSYVAAALEAKGPVTREALREAERYAESEYLVDLIRGLQDKAAVERRGRPRAGPHRARRASSSSSAPGASTWAPSSARSAGARGRIVSAYDAGISGFDPDPTAGSPEHRGPGPHRHDGAAHQRDGVAISGRR